MNAEIDFDIAKKWKKESLKTAKETNLFQEVKRRTIESSIN